MAKKFGVSIDLGKNELQNARIQNLSSAPSSPVTGQIYYNTTDNKLYGFNGTIWLDLTSSGGASAYSDLTGAPIVIVSGAASGALASDVSSLVEDGKYALVTTGYYKLTSADNARYSKGNTVILFDTYAALSAIILDETGVTLATIDGNTSEVTTTSYIPLSQKGVANGVATLGSDTKLTSSQVPDLSSTYITAAQKGAVNGVATLGADGLVPSTQLPSYVDDVVDVATYSDLPATGETGVIYVTLDTNKTYRWSGSTYIEISQSEIHKYTGTITGNGSSTSFTIQHGLGTKDVIINVYDTTTNADIIVDTIRTSTTVVTVQFAQAPASTESYKVVVIA